MSEVEKAKRTRRDSGPGARPYRRNGQFFNCQFCGTEFYRKASFIARGITKTCGARSTISASMQRERNPFWGKEHTSDVKAALSQAKTSKPLKPRYAAMVARQKSPEGRKETSERMKRQWAEKRDAMLALFQRAPKPREEQRYRKNFTPWQRKSWKGDNCAWCKSTENLVLDHVIPVIDGGLNLKENAQTLCQPCNLWKAAYVDRPIYLARLAIQGGSVS